MRDNAANRSLHYASSPSIAMNFESNFLSNLWISGKPSTVNTANRYGLFLGFTVYLSLSESIQKVVPELLLLRKNEGETHNVLRGCFRNEKG